jgi:nicotinate-nucleotide adenylyltransferase
MNNNFSEEMLSSLRESVKNEMGEKRYFHTLEVEKMAAHLGEIFAKDQISMLRAAASLHDVTKERTNEEHIAICEEAGLIVTKAERKSPKMFHAKTAALVIPKKYHEFAIPELISAVRYHTTGRADMTMAEKIIYLADYIDMSRDFEDCVKLRDMFFSAKPEDMNEEERLKHLDRVLLASYDINISALIR